jgi:fluoride exporter
VPASDLPLDPDAPPRSPLHRQAVPIALVFVGGVVGTHARYGLAQAWPTTSGAWPWGTFAANLAGSFVLGALLEGLARRGPDVGRRQRLRLLGGTGFCGGFTTYSTFAVEVDLLIRADADGIAIGYLAASVVGGVVAAVAGVALASRGRRA